MPHMPTTLHLKAAVDATAAMELAPRVKAAVRDALKAAGFADRVLFDEDALAGGVAGAVMAEILRIRQATPAESAQARSIARVRALHREDVLRRVHPRVRRALAMPDSPRARRRGAVTMPEYAAIKFTRHQGQGITVDEAPPRARMDLQVLADRYAYLHMPAPDVIVFADQVVYKVTGYSEGALLLELVEDWRPAPTVQLPLTDEQAEEIKTRWKEQHGNGQAVHHVVVLNEENPDA